MTHSLTHYNVSYLAARSISIGEGDEFANGRFAGQDRVAMFDNSLSSC